MNNNSLQTALQFLQLQWNTPWFSLL